MTSLSTTPKPPLQDRAHRAFVLRKLHSLAGVVPLGGFFLVHIWTNATALGGQGPFDEAVAAINRLPLLPLFEAGILVPLAFHALYGVKLAFEGRPNVGRYALARNWMYTMQRVSGLAALVFLLYHLWQLWLPKTLGTLAPSSFYPRLAADLSSTWHGVPLVGLGYVLGLAASCFHFANGLWGFCASWGITETPRAQRRAGLAFGLLGLGVFLLGADTALFFATGSRLFGGPPDDRPASARAVREPTAAMHQVRPLERSRRESSPW